MTDDEIVRLRQRADELRRKYIESAWALRDTLNEIQQHAAEAKARAAELRAEGYVIAAEFIEHHLEVLAEHTTPGFAEAAQKLIRVLGEPSPADAILLADRFDKTRQRYRWARACLRAFEEVEGLKREVESATNEEDRALRQEFLDLMLPGIAQVLRSELGRIEPAAKTLTWEQVEAALRGRTETPWGLAERLAFECAAFGHRYDPDKLTEEKVQRNQVRVAFRNSLKNAGRFNPD